MKGACSTLRRRLAWFVMLWLASVLSLTIVAEALRAAIAI